MHRAIKHKGDIKIQGNLMPFKKNQINSDGTIVPATVTSKYDVLESDIDHLINQLPGSPIWDTHDPPQIGHIDSAFKGLFDPWVHIDGRIFGPEKIGEEKYNQVLKDIKKGKYNGLSVGFIASGQESDPSNIKNRTIVEVSICETPYFDGANIYSFSEIDGNVVGCASDKVKDKKFYSSNILDGYLGSINFSIDGDLINNSVTT